MKFGEFPLYDATGVELAHELKCGGKVFPVGHIITADDVRLLRQAEIKTVVGAFFDSNDLRPDTACDILLKDIAGDHLRYTLPENGCSEFYADADGVFIGLPDRLLRFNSHNESLILSTLLPYTPVYKNQLIGSLRLLGPAFNADMINEAVEKITGQGPLLRIAPYAFCKIAYIRTVEHGGDVEESEEDVQNRYAVYGFDIERYSVCVHDREAVAKEIDKASSDKLDAVFIESSTAPLNRSDIVPMAAKEAGADIDRLGWCADPGVSALVAHKNDMKIIAFKTSDFTSPSLDRLIRYIATKSLPPAEEFPTLATGTLSLERLIKFLKPEDEAKTVRVGALSERSKIAVVVLAAGSSKRMIGTNKLLENIHGIPMVERVVRSALMSKADFVAVVTGYDAKFIERRLSDYDVKIVRNPDYAAGVLSSIRLGLSVLPPDTVAALVLPADMPGFTAQYIDRLIELFDPKATRKAVCLPSYNGVRHNPVLWPRELFKVVKIVPEDAHWMPALVEHSDYIKELKLDSDLPISDITTRGDLALFLERADFSDDAEKVLEELEASLK